jgi:flavin reductase (DIM6/NTAB) family NADH-FMN oxidoreductase RutF
MGRTAKAFRACEAVENFAVNILAEEQSGISTRFAWALTDKWDGIEPRTGINGSPLLPGALAWLECAAYAITKVAITSSLSVASTFCLCGQSKALVH